MGILFRKPLSFGTIVKVTEGVHFIFGLTWFIYFGVQPCWNVQANIKRQTWKESEHKISMWVKNGYKKILIISQRRWTIMTHNLTTAIQTHPRWKECSSLCCKPQTLQWSQGILTWAKSDIDHLRICFMKNTEFRVLNCCKRQMNGRISKIPSVWSS